MAFQEVQGIIPNSYCFVGTGKTVRAIERLMGNKAIRDLSFDAPDHHENMRNPNYAMDYERNVLFPAAGRLEMFAVCVNIGIYDFGLVKRVCGTRLVSLWEDHYMKHMVAHRRKKQSTVYCEIEALVKKIKEKEDKNDRSSASELA